MITVLYISAALHILLGLIVSIRRPINKTNIIFSCFLVFIAAWSLTNAFFQNSSNEKEMFTWALLAYTSATLMLFFLFLFSFLVSKLKLPKSVIWASVAVTVLSFIAPYIPNLIISGVNFETRSIVGGPYLGMLFLTYLYLIVFVIRNLIKGISVSNNILKLQLRLITFGIILSITFGVTLNLILPAFNNYSFVALGPSFTLATLSLSSYAIVKYRFLDVRILLSRIVYFLALGGFAYITFYALILFDVGIIGGLYKPAALVIGILNAVIFVTSYDFINKLIKQKINPRIVNPEFNPDEETATFNNMISQDLAIDKILEKSTSFLLKVLDIQNVFIFVESSNGTLIRAGKEDSIPKQTIETIYKILMSTEKSEIITDEIELYEEKEFGNFKNELKTIYSMCKANDIKMITKLKSLNNQSGAIFVLDQNNVILNLTKIKFIRSIVDLISLSLGRAFLYMEVQKFNSTLQQKIDYATTELTSKNQQLEEALRKERDMLDILGHELRTPLSTSRNSLNIIDIYKKQGKLDEANLNHHLDIAKENLTREIKILETILSSSRIDNSRLQLNNEEVEANDVIEDSVLSYKEQAEKKGLTIKTVLPTDKIYCYGDRSATQQIIDNLVSNAIKYTQKGSVTLETKLEGDNVVFAVSDTGEGIPAEEIPNLGKKFYRINPYLESEGKIGDRQIVRPGGTGIGLYVVFKLATMMNGTVNVTSEVGKGSTFTIKLPRFNPQIHEIKKVVEEQQPVKAEALVV